MKDFPLALLQATNYWKYSYFNLNLLTFYSENFYRSELICKITYSYTVATPWIIHVVMAGPWARCLSSGSSRSLHSSIFIACTTLAGHGPVESGVKVCWRVRPRISRSHLIYDMKELIKRSGCNKSSTNYFKSDKKGEDHAYRFCNKVCFFPACFSIGFSQILMNPHRIKNLTGKLNYAWSKPLSLSSNGH